MILKRHAILFKANRLELKKELSALSEEVSQDEKSLQASKDEFESLIQAEEKLREEVGGAEESIKALEEILKTAAKDVIELVNTSLITYENPLKKELLAPFLKPDRFPNMDDIEYLVKILFEEIEKSGEIRKWNGAFINSQGTESAGTILRIGKFTACYQQGDETGYLKAVKICQSRLLFREICHEALQSLLKNILQEKMMLFLWISQAG